MRNRKRAICLAVFLVSLLALGCATTSAPRGYLTGASDLPTDVYGGWIELTCSAAAKTAVPVSGELIAVGRDSVYVVNDSLRAIALADVTSGRLARYGSDATAMGVLVFFGTLSTISNGIWLGFTAPMWIIGGSSAVAIRRYEPMVDYPQDGWGYLARYARYPQGMPPGLDRSRIKIKPYVKSRLTLGEAAR